MKHKARLSFARLSGNARVEVSARLFATLIAYATLADDDTVRQVRMGLTPGRRASCLRLARLMLAQQVGR